MACRVSNRLPGVQLRGLPVRKQPHLRLHLQRHHVRGQLRRLRYRRRAEEHGRQLPAILVQLPHHRGPPEAGILASPRRHLHAHTHPHPPPPRPHQPLPPPHPHPHPHPHPPPHRPPLHPHAHPHLPPRRPDQPLPHRYTHQYCHRYAHGHAHQHPHRHSHLRSPRSRPVPNQHPHALR